MKFLAGVLAILVVFSGFSCCFAENSENIAADVGVCEDISGKIAVDVGVREDISEKIAVDVSACEDIHDSISAVESGEVSFLISRATQGTEYVDPNCDHIYQFAKSRGLSLGVYHALFRSSPREQARFFSANTQGYFDEAVFFLDIEETGGFSKKNIPEILSVAGEFLDEWYLINPDKPIYLYASAAIFDGYVQEWKDLFLDRPVWLAIWLHNSDNEENVVQPFPSKEEFREKLGSLTIDISELDAEDVFLWQYRSGNPRKDLPESNSEPLFPLDTNIAFLSREEWSELI